MICILLRHFKHIKTCLQTVPLFKVNIILTNIGSFGGDTTDFNLKVLKETSEL